MKRIFLVAATAAMALSSCSKNEIASSSSATMSSDAIGFSTFVGVSTKGLVTDNSDANSTDTKSIKDGFGVYGYYHSAYDSYSNTAAIATFGTTSTPNFMSNQKVSYISDAWTYSPVKYWPNNTNDRISFFAYAPYDSDVIAISHDATTKQPIITFSVKGTPVSMVDLVADMHYNVQKGDAGGSILGTPAAETTVDQEVAFSFEHLLCRATINAVLGDDIVTSGATTQTADSTKVWITGLWLVGKNNADLYDFDGTAQQSTGFRSVGVFKVNDAETVHDADDPSLGVWDYTATDNAFRGVNISLAVEDLFAGYGSTAGFTYDDYTGNTYTHDDALEITSTSKSLFVSNQYLFLIPQQSSEKVCLYIEYDVVTADPELEGGHSVVTNHAIVELTGLNAMGTAYAYNLTLGLSSVKVSATIDDDWTVTQEYEADVEIEVETTASGVTATATSVDGLTTALTALNTFADESSLTAYSVDASTVDLTATQEITLSTCNFENGDTITFTFKEITNSALITITGGTGLTFTSTTTDNVITIAVETTPV